jgi:hypothetical protein
MSEAKGEPKTQVERLVSEFGAQDLGTYMDARVEDKVYRVAVWNEGLKSYQPTEDGLMLLAGSKPEKAKVTAKMGAKVEAPVPQPPAGRPTTG